MGSFGISNLNRNGVVISKTYRECIIDRLDWVLMSEEYDDHLSFEQDEL
jgi:hypothetical protein